MRLEFCWLALLCVRPVPKSIRVARTHAVGVRNATRAVAGHDLPWRRLSRFAMDSGTM